MKKIKASLFALIGICVTGITLSTVSITRAWLSSGEAFGNQNLQASSVSNYFAAGDGSEEHPFIINQPVHMYNLSWLQARGVFDTTKTYFKVSDLSGNPVTIDFAGALTGTTTTTGALPPIGTDAHHFIGEFDGNGSVFKNVWVSSNPEDWKEKPIDIGDANTNTHVGFFGNIDQNNENKGVVKDFILENIEVTSHVTNSFVGLIAGYSNSYTQNIGVKNGKLTFRQGNMNHYMSEASLIGKVGSEAYWEDVPSDGSAGGELKIDPNSTEWSGGAYSGVANGSTLAVPNSVPGTAYLSGLLNNTQHALGTVYKYNTKLSFSNTYANAIAANSSNSTNATRNRTLCSGEFWQSYDANTGGSRLITPTTAPTHTSVSTITTDSGTLQIPRNCIWFKPQALGTCGISFTVGNMKDSRYMSIYRYKRTGTTIPDYTTWQHIDFLFDKNDKSGVVKNSNVLYYEVELDHNDDLDYEYCISITRGANVPGDFFFLYLAGTNTSGGPSEGMALLKNLDYVYKYNGQYLPSFDDENYRPNHLKLIFDFNAETDDIIFLFNMDDIANSTYVYYYANGADLVNMVTYETVGVLETTTTRFPARQET